MNPRQKRALKQRIRSNRHELYLVSLDEMDNIIRSSPKAQKASVKDAWEKLRGSIGNGASYYSLGDDIVTLTKLMSDLGAIGTRAYVKSYNGKPHIILKGYPGLRRVLTGTKYGIKNPKVITMGLGRAGAVHAAKTGGIISVVLLSAFRVADYFLRDQSTLSRLIGSLATDVVKVGIATGASIASVSVMAAFGVTVAIGPILAVILVGGTVSFGLQLVDDRYRITDKLVNGLDTMGSASKAEIMAIKQNLKEVVNRGQETVIDYFLESVHRVIISFAKHKINRFIGNNYSY